MRTLQDEFSQIEIGCSSEFRNLALFPLRRVSVPTQPLDYILLEDGIAQGNVRVTELHAGGSVPELRLENNAELPVLLVDGEELVGAKQNRVLNLTILAPAKQTTVIPVSCVESGRWRMASSLELTPAAHVMYSAGREERMAQVTASMRSTGTRKSDQAAVWSSIAAKASRLKTSSPTGAMSAIYERHASSLEEFARAFTWEQGQCGVSFAISGRILGLEIFERPEVLRKFFQKLVRSYALDALDTAATEGRASVEAVCALVTQIGAASSFMEQALGIGKDVRFTAPGIGGAALWAHERYLHICAFANNTQNTGRPGFWTRITRPSHRRTF